MKLSNLSKKLSLSLVAAAVAAAGLVAYAQPKAGPTSATAPAAATAPVAASEPAPPNPIAASIGNAGLRRDDFTNILIAVGGLRVFDEYWGYAVVMQAVEQSGITVTKEDVQKVKDDIAKKIVIAQVSGTTTGPATSAATLSSEEKDKAIYKFLVDRGIATNPQIDWYFGTYAGLQILADKVAKDVVTPTPKEIEMVQKVTFGEHANVIDFIVKDEKEGAEVIDLLIKEKPEAVAQKGHRAQPMVVAKDDENIPDVFKTQIFGNLKVNTSSSLPQKDTRTGAWHVLYLVSKDAARPVDKDELKKAQDTFAEAKSSQWRTQHLNKLKLLSINSVRINDPILQQQFNSMIAQLRAQQEAQAAALASQPAPATMPGK